MSSGTIGHAMSILRGGVPACGCRAADERHELAPLHSITWSARAMTVGGTAVPSPLATEAVEATPPIHVRSTFNSDHKFKALEPVAMLPRRDARALIGENRRRLA